MMTNIHRTFPNVVSGYELSTKYGWFSILEPSEMINLVTNPDFGLGELNPSGVTYFNDTPGSTANAIITTEQRRGPYCVEITPATGIADAGFIYTIENDTTGVSYTVGFDFKGNAGHTYAIYAVRTDSAVVNYSTFVANGHWERKYITIYKASAPPSVVSVRCTRVKPLDNALPFYFDGFCMTLGADKTTYFDGSSHAYGDAGNYSWVGEPHNSPSKREANELSSGVIRNLYDYGYHVLGFSGLGLTPQKHTILENALLGGGTFQRGQDEVREYYIVGSLANLSMAEMFRNRKNIEALLRNSHTMQQPLTVRAEFIDDNGEPFSQPVHMRSLYAGGFEGNSDNLYQDRSSLQFRMDRPKILEDGDEGSALTTYQSISSLGYMARRVPGYGWDNWDTGANGAVHIVKFDESTGRIYVGGNYTQIGSAPLVVNRFAYWDIHNEAFGGLFVGAGANSHVYDIAIHANGDPYICGAFTTIEGNACTGIAWYDVDSVAWGYSASLPTGTAYAMAFASNGYELYIVGVETGVGGYVYRHNTLTGAFTDLTSGGRATTGVYGVALDKDDNVYVVGSFTTINAVSANNIAKWDGSTWYAIGDGLEGGVGRGDDIEFGDDGNMYVIGSFDTGDDISVNDITYFNGQSFFSMGSGIAGTVAANTKSLKWHDGKLYVGINSSSAYPSDRPTALYISDWNGTSWSHTDFLPNSYVKNIDFDNNGVEYICGNFTSAVAGEYTSVENTGTANAEPIITVTGEMVTPAAHTWDDKILWIRNETTEQTVYLDLEINEFEIIKFDFRRGINKIISDSRGDITRKLLPSSDFASFYLAPGENLITVYVESVSLVSTIYWAIPHDYIGGAIF